MDDKKWEIKKYVTATGTCTFDEWFDTLDNQARARIDVRLDRVSLGNFGDHKSVGGGVYELRFTFGPGYRIYYGLIEKRVILLLIGGSKQKQSQDIKTAQKYLQTYLSEYRGGH